MKLDRTIRTVPLAMLAVAVVSPLASAAIIAQQGFESTASDNYGYTFTTAGATATAAVVTSASSFPTSTPVASGTHGFLSYRTTTTTMLFDKVDLTGTTGGQVSLRLAALATTTANGEDLGDAVSIYISSGTGSFASSPASGTFAATPDLTVTGNGNARWSYTGGTGIATNANPLVTTFTPASGGGDRTTDGYSTLLVNLPATATYFFMQVVIADDNTTEAWAVDDVTVSAVPEPATLGMAGVGGVLALARRRRSRA